jgi:hypothetical protein
MTVMELEPQDPWKHRLLANLNEEDRRLLIPHMEKVFVLPREVIYWPSRPIDYVYFPLSAVFSLLPVAATGSTKPVFSREYTYGRPYLPLALRLPLGSALTHRNPP